MTASSDLDLILVYDFDEEHPESDGARPLYGAQYFARLTKRLISALTSPTNYGALYHVDMRLRPSGRSGPVATKIDSFRDYQKNEAWTWEHMALTRARVVSASPAVSAEVEGGDPRRAGAAPRCATDCRRRLRDAHGDRDREGRGRSLGPEICRRRADRHRIHRAVLQLVHAAEHPDLLDPSTARVLERAARLGAAVAGGFRGAAAGGAALSESEPDPAAVPVGTVRSEKGRCRPAAIDGARRRRAGFRHPRRPCRPRPRRACASGSRCYWDRATNSSSAQATAGRPIGADTVNDGIATIHRRKG